MIDSASSAGLAARAQKNDIAAMSAFHTTTDKIIIALDLPDVAAARRLVETLGDAGSFYKIGYELAFTGGLDFARELIDAGKKVFELRPNVDWDKGRALLRLMSVLGVSDDDVVPIYVGDDVTDEDAFAVVRDHGIGVVVRGEDDDRATAATYSLVRPEDVGTFLEKLWDLCVPSEPRNAADADDAEAS